MKTKEPKWTIQNAATALRDGSRQIKRDIDNTDLLEKILLRAFPKDKYTSAHRGIISRAVLFAKNKFIDSNEDDEWTQFYEHSTPLNLPIINLSEIEPDEKEESEDFRNGEEVEYSAYEGAGWSKAIYCCKHPNDEDYHIVMKNGNPAVMRYCRRPQPEVETIDVGDFVDLNVKSEDRDFTLFVTEILENANFFKGVMVQIRKGNDSPCVGKIGAEGEYGKVAFRKRKEPLILG